VKKIARQAGLSALLALLLCSVSSARQTGAYLSSLAATKDSPLFTTYAAPESRSEFTLDKGYHLLLNDQERGADLTNESGGDICLAFKSGGKYVYALKDMFRQPVITASYSDIVTYAFWPFDSVCVNVTFVVYSSHHAVQAINVRSTGSHAVQIEILPFLRTRTGTYNSIGFRKDAGACPAVVGGACPAVVGGACPAVVGGAITFTHEESPDEWVLEHGIPYVGSVKDLFVVSDPPDRMMSLRSYRRGTVDTTRVIDPSKGDTLDWVLHPSEGEIHVRDSARIIAFSCSYDLRPGVARSLVTVRSVARPADDTERLIDTARSLTRLDLPACLQNDERLYGSIPPLPSADPGMQMLYWSAFSLMRQVMLPPEGKCRYNYYVFSREPQWGWGHGGQVFHESLTMLSYALMDPVGAMNSQRVYMERQKPDGYINYRTGPYLDEQIPYNGQLTTSAPWYAWQNWEIYRVTRDRKFLEDAYASSASFYRYYCKNRDSDGDGLSEWGAHAVLESVRDGMVAVWDQVGWPAEFESLDLNSMLVSEAKSLTAMAMLLGRKSEAEAWERDVQERCRKINALMWDSVSGFYYNIDRKTHTFTFRTPGDLKRREIIGFLPLWAGIATKAQAARLVAALKDTSTFWRKYGVPSLAADDPYYNPKGYWNGPVWVQWNYLIVRGLLQYGYVREARELTGKVASAMIAQLKKDHNFWEFYSPDEAWAGYHRTYIWAGIINKMLIEVAEAPGN
jgi:hypothetical protein